MKKSIKINAILNIIKQCCSTLFPLITFSYASHILGENGIGIFSFSQTTISYLILIAALGIQSYGIKAGTRYKDEKNVFSRFASELFTINIIMTFVAYLILGVLLICWDYLDTYRNALLIYSCTILLNTIGADWINSVYEDYLYLTVRYLVVQILCLIALVIFVKTTDDILPYVFISMLSAAGGSLFNILYVRKYANLKVFFSKEMLIHIKPLLYLFGSSLAVIIYVNSDITILTIIKGNTLAGIYTAATKVYQAVKQILFAVITVIIPRMSYLVAKEDFNQWNALLLKLEKILFIIIVPATIGLVFQSKNVLTIFAGTGFSTGATALSILSFALVFAVISNVLVGVVMLPFNHEKSNFIITIIACVVNLGLNFIVIPYWGMEGAAVTTLIAEIINAMGSLIVCRSKVEIGLERKEIADVGIGTIGIIIVCLGVNLFEIGIVAETGISVVFSVMIYCLILLSRKNEEIIGILSYLKSWRSREI